MPNTDKLAILGLGYVGLPIALAFAKKFPTVGFDINQQRIEELKNCFDKTGEMQDSDLQSTTLQYTYSPDDMRDCNVYIVTVPTPIDKNKRPDLSALQRASQLIGKVLSKGDIVVYESTVYPGVTEEICGPILQQSSGLNREDFKLGYSPERINPGDYEHTFEKVTKVVSGEDAETLTRITQIYSSVIQAPVHQAPNIKTAEAAKVIENTQRDLNIALMNELSLIFDRLQIRTKDVLDAANTKWNFLPFTPGLVGGHCIGVDPYYLTAKAETLGYYPEVILSGRRINDSMGEYIAQRMVKLLIQTGASVKGTIVGILGVTFKENVKDFRNSHIPRIVEELKQFGIVPIVHDPLANPEEVEEEYGIKLCNWSQMQNLDGIILAVAHKFYVDMPRKDLLSSVREGGVFIDIKSILNPNELDKEMRYWSL